MNVLITTPPLNVFEHMALDEVLVRAYAGGNVLRFYNWADSSAVTFGYAQFISEVHREAQTQHFMGDICRRPTGGGVVYHKDDLTFSLIFSSPDKPTEIYKQLHGAIHAVFVLEGIKTSVFDQKLSAAAYAPSQHHMANTCFVNPVENDLLLENGQKMLGGAIRCFGNTILYQGSLQVSGARKEPAYKQAVIQGVRNFLNADFKITPASKQTLEQTRVLAQTQYNTSAWTEKF